MSILSLVGALLIFSFVLVSSQLWMIATLPKPHLQLAATSIAELMLIIWPEWTNSNSSVEPGQPLPSGLVI